MTRTTALSPSAARSSASHPGAGAATPARRVPVSRPAMRPHCACGGGCPRCAGPAPGATPSPPRQAAPLALGDAGSAPERQAERAVRDGAAARRVGPVASPGGTGGPAAPDSVPQVLSQPGRPLDGDVQRRMGRRYGHDFSGVSVHADAQAARSAAEMGARAYTVGPHIAFAAGQYAPHSPQGQALIAHELAHVVQQRGSAQPWVQRDLAQAPVPGARVQALTAEQLRRAVNFNSALFALPQTMALISDLLAPAAPGAESLAAAVGRWQAWRGLPQDGQLNDATLASIDAELTAERASLTAMGAQGVERVATGDTAATTGAGPASLGALPAATRQRLQVVNAPVALQREAIGRMMHPPSTNAPRHLQFSGMVEVFGAGIPQTARRALSDMAGLLEKFDVTEPDGTQHKALRRDSTIELEISLRPYMDVVGLFRFTRVASTGQETRDTLIIELLRTLPPMNTARLTLGPALAGAFDVSGTRFVAGAGWLQDNSAVLQSALALLPPAALAAAAGLTFVADAAQSGEAGHYDPDTDTVFIHANAFRVSNTRVGGTSEAVTVVLHEVGHAIDLRLLMGPPATPGGTRTAVAGATSRSGSRWLRGSDGMLTMGGEVTGGADTAFRRALAADRTGGNAPGARGAVTAYGETDWQEAWAESFMLYTTNPTLMQQLRPRTFAFLQGLFPR